MTHSLEYSSWSNMRQRCNNPKASGYINYGGRGISVCARWDHRNGFAAFIADMGPAPGAGYSIERSDVNGDYEPGNCRWATPREQSRNKSTTNKITLNGETLCLADWAAKLGCGAPTIQGRLDRGWSLERALMTPPVGITRAQAEEIRARLNGRNGAALAREFGVTRGTISHIKSGRIWK